MGVVGGSWVEIGYCGGGHRRFVASFLMSNIDILMQFCVSLMPDTADIRAVIFCCKAERDDARFPIASITSEWLEHCSKEWRVNKSDNNNMYMYMHIHGHKPYLTLLVGLV